MPYAYPTDDIPDFPAEINRDAFGHWLSGFTDGEGSFILSWSDKKEDAKIGNAIFSIQLRHDDGPVLDLIRSYWKCGRRHTVSRRCDGDRLLSNPCSIFKVSDRIALSKIIVPHFEKYPLRAKKLKDFTLWKQGLEMIIEISSRKQKFYGWGPSRRSERKWTREDEEKFFALASQLRLQRVFRAKH